MKSITLVTKWHSPRETESDPETWKLAFNPDKEDWCHFCGKRRKAFFEVFYEDNAEHPKGSYPNYVRMCECCYAEMGRLAN